MPKIPDYALNSVFFMHVTYDDAKDGINPMGTGFVASVPSGSSEGVQCPPHLYAITNRHNMFSYMRIVSSDGRTHVVPDEPEIDWVYGPDGVADDIAIAAIDIPNDFECVAVPCGLFLTQEACHSKSVNVGEDVFMLGLFVDHSAKGTLPKARFGNISAMPSDAFPIIQPNGSNKSSFILDMHSRSGFSGSPVFGFRTIGADLDHANISSMMLNEASFFYLLGVHWGQFPETFKVAGASVSLEGMSGMTCAIPAWRVLDLLNSAEFKQLRSMKEGGQR